MSPPSSKAATAMSRRCEARRDDRPRAGRTSKESRTGRKAVIGVSRSSGQVSSGGSRNQPANRPFRKETSCANQILQERAAQQKEIRPPRFLEESARLYVRFGSRTDQTRTQMQDRSRN